MNELLSVCKLILKTLKTAVIFAISACRTVFLTKPIIYIIYSVNNRNKAPTVSKSQKTLDKIRDTIYNERKY